MIAKKSDCAITSKRKFNKKKYTLTRSKVIKGLKQPKNSQETGNKQDLLQASLVRPMKRMEKKYSKTKLQHV